MKGKSYEKKLGLKLAKEIARRELGTLYSGQWLKFLDDNGKGFAQPDFFLVAETEIWLFECKLSQTAVAWSQMEKLYKPLLEHIFELPCRCVQVCKNLREPGDNIISGLDLDAMRDGVTLHWIGVR